MGARALAFLLRRPYQALGGLGRCGDANPGTRPPRVRPLAGECLELVARAPGRVLECTDARWLLTAAEGEEVVPIERRAGVALIGLEVLVSDEARYVHVRGPREREAVLLAQSPAGFGRHPVGPLGDGVVDVALAHLDAEVGRVRDRPVPRDGNIVRPAHDVGVRVTDDEMRRHPRAGVLEPAGRAH